MTQNFSVLSRGARLCALIFVATACGEQSSTEVGSVDSELTQPQWTFCANQGEQCSFSGTHRVRYTARNGSTAVRSFTDGVRCSGRAFDVRSRSGSCEYDASIPMQPSNAGTGSSQHDHGGAGTGALPMPMAGSDSQHDHGSAGTSSLPMPMAGSDSQHEHTAAGSGASGTAPYVDVSAIPTGDPGSDKVQIVNTSEKPVASDGTGAFRSECMFSHMGFDDPIVFPGQPGKSHLHAFFGNTGVNANTTAESLRTTGNSTCRGGIANRTGYWVPALLDAQGRPVKPTALEVYYKSGYNGVPASEIKPFPKGLRMVAGNAKSTSTQSAAYWGCQGAYIGKPGSIPDCNGNGLIMIVEFPQCWDGVNLDSADHKSHMAYANGRCPATHPVAIPAIAFNVMYPKPATPGGMRLASDMYDPSLPGGFSAHGDWFDGWDPDVVKEFVTNCINPAVDCHSHLLGDGRAIF